MTSRELVKSGGSTKLAPYSESVRKYVSASKADNTRRAYKSAWTDFSYYCELHALNPLPASAATLIAYLVFITEGGAKASTLQVKLSAISFNHQAARAPNPVKAPEVKALIAGIRRSIGTAQAQKTPVVMADIRKIVKSLPRDRRGKRDKAILLVGFAGAFRRSELVGLTVDDVRFSAAGMVITLRKSKTDQVGAGMVKTIPVMNDKAICPVTALRDWLDTAMIESGVVFRPIDRWGHLHAQHMDGREIARIIKARATAAGIDARQLAGHSLRAGYVTTCVNAGVQTWAIRQQTGHKSERAFEKYIRNAGLGATKATKTAFGE